MWNKRNWCERIILLSFSSLVLLFCYNVFLQRIICNSCLILYTSSIIIFTIWITCRDIQFLLEQNTPLRGHSDDVFAKHPQINVLKVLIYLLKRLLPTEDGVEETEETKRKLMNTGSLSDVSIIASVVERRCVWSWYSQYVSKEIAFPFACKQLLDQMVAKVFQVSYNIDTVSFYSDSLGIILKHCKEYKKAKRRFVKIGQGRIEEYYRNTHPTSPQRNSLSTCLKGKSTQSHCLLLTRCFLKELLPWELWGTPQSLLLASILAKRLDNYITSNLSNPAWIKYRIMKLLEPSFNNEDFKIDNTLNTSDQRIEIGNKQLIDEDFSEKAESTTPDLEKAPDTKSNVASDNIAEDSLMSTSIESALSNMISSSTAPILQRAELDDSSSKILLHIGSSEKLASKSSPSKPINISGSPLSIKKTNGSNDVKIYDKVLEGTVKTWNSDHDLECVSLGHDLLASLDGDIEARFGRLWEADAIDGSESWSPNPPSTGSSTKTPHGLWFGEDDNLDMELTEDSPPKHNTNNHTTNSCSNNHNMPDEAAGVMEGILDFGIAGLRKGLRLTGLQETQTEKSTLSSKSSEGISTLTSSIGNVLSRKNSHTDEINGMVENLKDASFVKEVDSNDGGKPANSQHLVKQQRISSQDSSYFSNLPKEKEQAKEEPSVEKDKESSNLLTFVDAIAVTGTDSPEYEYEEPADFESTIAKLRDLLQQKTSDLTPKSQDDSNLPDVTYSSNAIPISKPASATQPTNSPIHKVTASQSSSTVQTTKSEEIVSSPSMENDFGFTILSQNSSELVEAEEALNHKIEQITVTSIPQVNSANNMQRLDKLFTRTVTGVFNTIKTAVGADSLGEGVSGQAETGQAAIEKPTFVRAHQHKDDWIFVEGEMEVSKVVSKLLIERRGFCVVETEVEAGQDIVEVLGGTSGGQSEGSRKRHGSSSTPTSPCVSDDLDESDLLYGCPLYQMIMELVTVVMGGIMQKDAIVKCTSIIVADMVESILQNKLNDFNAWLATVIIECFHQLSGEPVSNASSDGKGDTIESQLKSVDIDRVCDALMKIIPDVLNKILGKDEMRQALLMIVSSVEHPLINRDVIFSLLDVAMLHFVRACSAQSCLPTPPPSA